MQFNKHLQEINIYEAGKPIELLVRSFGIAPENIIKMASNENPFGLSPKVAKVIAENSYKSYLYPDDSMFELKDSLSKRFEIEPHQIIIGAGSDQVLEFISKAILNPQAKVLMNKITFAMYSIYAKHQGATVLTTNSTEHDLNQFLKILIELPNEIKEFDKSFLYFASKTIKPTLLTQTIKKIFIFYFSP